MRVSLQFLIRSDRDSFKMEIALKSESDDLVDLFQKVSTICTEIESEAERDLPVCDFVSHMESVSALTSFSLNKPVTLFNDVPVREESFDVAGCLDPVRKIECVEIIFSHNAQR